MTDAGEWQGRVGDTWAEQWKRTDRSFGKLTEELLGRIGRKPFNQVLDIGCGAGELSLAIGRAHRDCMVTGLDISGSLVATARERGSGLANVQFFQADATDWRPGQDARPDLIVSRHGVMFFGEPEAAFSNLHAAAAAGGGLIFSCFRDRTENPFFTEVAALLPRPADVVDPRAPGPFAFAEPPYVGSTLERAGWVDVKFDRFDFAMIAGAGDDPVGEALAYWSAIGPAAAAMRGMSRTEQEAFATALRALAQDNCRDGIVALRAAAWIVSARAG